MQNRNRPATTSGNEIKPQRSDSQDIEHFLKTARQTSPVGKGRLIFALDATMSRQPTWDRACQIQASMFATAGNLGGLSIQLVYFRGFGECRASKWVTQTSALAGLMTAIDCRGGTTQITKVLLHAAKEHERKPVSALVFIGDAMEENIDQLCDRAGKLGIKGVKAFMFQEGSDRETERAFREVARLTNGAYMRLGSTSAKDLEELLSAVAAFASGGHKALEAQGGKRAKQLLEQLKP